jgi:hypothetical protein
MENRSEGLIGNVEEKFIEIYITYQDHMWKCIVLDFMLRVENF